LDLNQDEKALTMIPRNYFFIFFIALVFSGCGPDDGAKAKLFETQRSALDSAKSVASAVQQQAQEAQQSLDKQTQ
jgi:hypothetical protein